MLFLYRFITFSLDSEASIAAEKFNGSELLGKRLRVSVNDQNNPSQRGRSRPDSEDQESKAREANTKRWGSGNYNNPPEVQTFSNFGRNNLKGNICFCLFSAFDISTQRKDWGQFFRTERQHFL